MQELYLKVNIYINLHLRIFLFNLVYYEYLEFKIVWDITILYLSNLRLLKSTFQHIKSHLITLYDHSKTKYSFSDLILLQTNMPFRFVFRTADISALSRSLSSAEISSVRYTNMNGLIVDIDFLLFILLYSKMLVKLWLFTRFILYAPGIICGSIGSSPPHPKKGCTFSVVNGVFFQKLPLSKLIICFICERID